MKTKERITVIIPTLNEESFIEEAIKCVSFADEVIVIDSFSDDKTTEIAESLGAKVIKRKFDDFSTQKNYAIAKATHNWIYVLDADERITDALQKEILYAVQCPEDYVGFYVYRNFYVAGKLLKFGGIQNDKVIRLFRKDVCKYDGKLVHEKIVAKGKIGFFKNRLDHYSYRSYNQHINKLNKYAELRAKSLFQKGAKVTLYHILIKPPVRFIIHYIIKLGFLDGYRGLMISFLKSYGVRARYIKLLMIKEKIK